MLAYGGFDIPNARETFFENDKIAWFNRVISFVSLNNEFAFQYLALLLAVVMPVKTGNFLGPYWPLRDSSFFLLFNAKL